jgi:hypothetical protein
MVQLKRDLRHMRDGTANNKYWAVGGEPWDVQWEESRFRKKKYENLISAPVTARVVTDRANRKERGLLNYENCSIDELEAFIGARRLILPSADSYNIHVHTTTISFRDTKDRQFRRQEQDAKIDARRAKAKKAAYIAVLHDADDTAVFDRYFQLPPEVSTIVYKQYHDDLPTLPVLPHQPPLTVASKPLREEALPSFYDQATFDLRLFVHTQAWLHGYPPTSVVFPHNTFDDPNLLTSANLSPANLARISRLHLRLSHLNTYHRPGSNRIRNDEKHLSWDIDLNGNGEERPFISGDSSIEHFAADPFWAVRRGRLELAILGVARDVAGRPKTQRLKRSDLEDLQKAVREALDAPVNA